MNSLTPAEVASLKKEISTTYAALFKAYNKLSCTTDAIHINQEEIRINKLKLDTIINSAKIEQKKLNVTRTAALQKKGLLLNEIRNVTQSND